jgi:pimeloyl-ACP methyl ester carboxylesterase
MVRSSIGLVLSALLVASPALSAPAEAPGKLVGINGITMHYQERGSGEPLLLLHGFGMCGFNDWAHVVDALAKNHRVIMPDLRGHGWSTNPSNKFTMRQSARDIRALLDKLGLRQVKAMGISAGAMTLLHLSIDDPARISSMVLIGATNAFPQQARDVVRTMDFDNQSTEMRGYLSACTSRGDDQARGLMRQMRGFATSYDDMNLTPADLARIRARTLIIHGDRDEFFPIDVPVTLYKAIPTSQLWVVPNGDHVPIHGTRTPEFVRVATAFLDTPAK